MDRSEFYRLTDSVTDMALRYGAACTDVGALIGHEGFHPESPAYIRLDRIRTRRRRALRRLAEALARAERPAA